MNTWKSINHNMFKLTYVTGPAMVVSVVSLLVNVLLVGGARQTSKDFLLVWIVWKSIAVVLFWAW